MKRDETNDDPGPVLIARLQTTDNAVLCGEKSGVKKGMGRRM